MDSINRFETVSAYNAFNNHETLHPLVSVIDFSKADPRRLQRTYFGFYLVLLIVLLFADRFEQKNSKVGGYSSDEDAFYQDDLVSYRS